MTVWCVPYFIIEIVKTMNSRMKKPMTEQEALLRATTLCAQCEQCEHNIREKMVKWGLDSGACDRIIDYLYDEKYLDEQRFAHAYARDKMRYNRWGRKKIEQGLRLLRVGTSSCREALADLPEEEYRDILADILNTKARSVKAESGYERNGKLIRFAIGRGFEMDLILQCLPDRDEVDYEVD